MMIRTLAAKRRKRHKMGAVLATKDRKDHKEKTEKGSGLLPAERAEGRPGFVKNMESERWGVCPQMTQNYTEPGCRHLQARAWILTRMDPPSLEAMARQARENANPWQPERQFGRDPPSHRRRRYGGRGQRKNGESEMFGVVARGAMATQATPMGNSVV
jgi:hypothetical protein